LNCNGIVVGSPQLESAFMIGCRLLTRFAPSLDAPAEIWKTGHRVHFQTLVRLWRIEAHSFSTPFG